MLQGPEGGGLTVAVMLVVPVYAVNIDGVLGDGRTEDVLGTEEGQGEGRGDTQTQQEDDVLHGQSVLLFYLYCRQYVSHTQYKLIRRQSYDYRHMKK